MVNFMLDDLSSPKKQVADLHSPISQYEALYLLEK